MARKREIKTGIHWVGAVDWDRRLFDSLIPLPDGTSYNAYLVEGTEKTALIDTVDPAMSDILFSYLEDVPKIDYIIANHAEQDHSGTLPALLEKYGRARLVTTQRGRDMLMDLLLIPEDRFVVAEDGGTIGLGGRTLRFIHTPWVHWPETMSTFLEEENILFPCDFFGSHLASSSLFVDDEPRVLEAAKRYYAEIMMPFGNVIRKNIEKFNGLDIDMIAPGHGPVYNRPAMIIEAYLDWTSEKPKNEVVLPYVSMHGSTAAMVARLVASLSERNVVVHQFNMADTDIGKLAISLVDAATIVVGTPTVHYSPHPRIVHAVHLANVLRPKARWASVVGSYGWAGKTAEQITGMLSNLKIEFLDPVICRGFPRENDFLALDEMAGLIEEKHKTI